jgi:hypothetical protein
MNFRTLHGSMQVAHQRDLPTARPLHLSQVSVLIIGVIACSVLQQFRKKVLLLAPFSALCTWVKQEA